MLQADFAKKSDLDPSYVSLLENNHKSPTLTVYFRICETLRIAPSELMKRIEKTGAAEPRKPKAKKKP